MSICNALLQEPEPPRRRGLEDLLAALAERARAGDAAVGGSNSQDDAPGPQSSAPAEQSAAQPSMAQLEEGNDQQSAPARLIERPPQCLCSVSGLPQSYIAVQALHLNFVPPMQTFLQPLLSSNAIPKALSRLHRAPMQAIGWSILSAWHIYSGFFLHDFTDQHRAMQSWQ